ncbi:hypothetical protein BH23PAT1_BH23PAT1_1990 [soil metagenome]
MGKSAMHSHAETIYSMGFLGLFWAVVFFAASPFFGIDFRLDSASLPTLFIRVILEILVAYLVIRAISVADRTTTAFLALLTIPLLLIVDISIGYRLQPMQIIGVLVILAALASLFGHNPKDKPGVKLVILAAIMAVATTSLYKYNITNYNSVAGEQLVVTSCLLLFFGLFSGIKTREHPIRLLFRPFSGVQSLFNGLGIAALSFAYLLAPPSIVITLKRSLSLLWAIFFGRAFFHEKALGHKLIGFAVVVVGITLITFGQ